MVETQDTILTIGKLAAYPALSKSTLYHSARAGKVLEIKVGLHWRFHREQTDAWIKTRQGPSGSVGDGLE